MDHMDISPTPGTGNKGQRSSRPSAGARDSASTSEWTALVVIAVGLFPAVSSTTMVSVALPSIQRDIGVTASEQEWIVDAYVIVYSSLLVAGGVLGDRRGRKGLFMLGAALFGLGALLAGCAPGVPVLLVGRVIQGLGPALLVPGSLTIIRAIFVDPKQRDVAIGLWSTASGVALAVGPALGGVLVESGNWRWVFLINAPLSVILIVLAGLCVPRLPRNPATASFDWIGALLITAGIALLAVGTIEGPDAGWSSLTVVGSFVLGVVMLVGLVVRERCAEAPLIRVELFTRPAFIAANVAAMTVFFAFVGGIVYLSQYFQRVQGDSVIRTGLEVSVIGIAFAVASSQSGRLVARIGAEIPMLVGLLIAGCSTLALLRLGADTPYTGIWWNFILLGLGIGLSLTPMTSVAMSAVGSEHAGMVSAIHNALRQVGQVFGVSVLGAIVTAGLAADDQDRPGLTGDAGSSFIDGLHDSFIVSGAALLLVAGLAAVLFLIARRSTPDDPELVEAEG